jgi:hypothetical protein
MVKSDSTADKEMVAKAMNNYKGKVKTKEAYVNERAKELLKDVKYKTNADVQGLTINGTSYFGGLKNDEDLAREYMAHALG